MSSGSYSADEEAKRLMASGAGGGVLGALNGFQAAHSHPNLAKYAKKATLGGGGIGALLGAGGLGLGDLIMGKGDDDALSDMGHGALGGGILGAGAGLVGTGKLPGGSALAEYLAKSGKLGGGGKVANMIKMLGLGTAYGGLMGAGHSAAAATFNDWRRDHSK